MPQQYGPQEDADGAERDPVAATQPTPAPRLADDLFTSPETIRYPAPRGWTPGTPLPSTPADDAPPAYGRPAEHPQQPDHPQPPEYPQQPGYAPQPDYTPQPGYSRQPPPYPAAGGSPAPSGPMPAGPAAPPGPAPYAPSGPPPYAPPVPSAAGAAMRSPALLLAGGGVVLLLIGLVVPQNDRSWFQDFPMWTVVALALAGAVVWTAVGGGRGTPLQRLLAIIGGAGIGAWWLLLVLPGVASNIGCLLTLAAACLGASAWLVTRPDAAGAAARP